MGFLVFSRANGKLMGKTMHFPHAANHRMGIGWEKRSHAMSYDHMYGKEGMSTNQILPHTMGFVAFCHTMGRQAKPMHFPYDDIH